jgi:dienelactone hydrolase
MPKSGLLSRILTGVGLLALLFLLGLSVLLTSIWIEHHAQTILPTPSGQYGVGRAFYEWVDNQTDDPLAPAPGIKRELLVWIWYPAPAGQSQTLDDYLPAPIRSSIERYAIPPIFKLFSRDLSNVRAHGIWNASLSPQQPSFPVVILRAGASSEVWNYSSLAEDLASHGYVVVGFDAPYRTSIVVFPDGRVIRRLPANNPELCAEMPPAEQESCANKLLAAWTSDMSSVLNQLDRWNASDPSGKFTGRLDLTRVGAFGHSFGGAAALRFCQEDFRCKAAIDVDGAPHGSVIQTGIPRPLMLLLSDHSHESDAESQTIFADLHSLYDRSPADSRSFLEIRGANHFLFSDDGALLKSHMVLGALRTLGIVGIEGRRQLAVTSYCLRSFFDAYLIGGTAALPKIPSPLYPEIKTIK